MYWKIMHSKFQLVNVNRVITSLKSSSIYFQEWILPVSAGVSVFKDSFCWFLSLIGLKVDVHIIMSSKCGRYTILRQTLFDMIRWWIFISFGPIHTFWLLKHEWSNLLKLSPLSPYLALPNWIRNWQQDCIFLQGTKQIIRSCQSGTEDGFNYIRWGKNKTRVQSARIS